MIAVALFLLALLLAFALGCLTMLLALGKDAIQAAVTHQDGQPRK